LGIGDWGLGIGDWGIGEWGLGPIPNPQSPSNIYTFTFSKFINLIKLKKKYNDF